MTRIFRINILLIFLLQGSFAIERISLCVHKDGSVKLELSGNCCEDQGNVYASKDDCNDCDACDNIPFFGESLQYVFQSKAKIYVSMEVFAEQIVNHWSLRDIEYKANFSPHDKILRSKSNQLTHLKKIILLI